MTQQEAITPQSQLEADALSRIDRGEASVGVIGLGYVGLPLAHAFATGGLRAVGFDIDPRKIDCLAKGENYLKHLGEQMAKDLAGSDRFTATTDFLRLSEVDAVIVAVPTPLGKHQEPDLSYVESAGRAIGRSLKAGQLICLESTTYPGTTRGEFLTAMREGFAETHGEAASEGGGFPEIFVAFSPEREDPGRKDHNTKTIPKLVGGLDDASTRLACALYGKAVKQPVPVKSAEVAEAAKLLENIFRGVNIALVNEMKVILAELGVDIWEVVEAASTKPFGFMPFFPGPGLGGHCIPIDPFYLTWKAKEVGRSTRFIELAGEVNTQMPSYVIERLMLALNAQGKPVKGSKVLVMGLAYKPNVDDTRESPSFELIQKLRELGADVDYSDPHVPETYPVRKHDLGMKSVEPSPGSVAAYDAVLIATAHDIVDWSVVAEHAKLVVDTRNAMKDFAEQMGDRLVKA